MQLFALRHKIIVLYYNHISQWLIILSYLYNMMYHIMSYIHYLLYLLIDVIFIDMAYFPSAPTETSSIIQTLCKSLFCLITFPFLSLFILYFLPLHLIVPFFCPLFIDYTVCFFSIFLFSICYLSLNYFRKPNMTNFVFVCLVYFIFRICNTVGYFACAR